MAVTNFTPLLGLALPTTGDLSGTWGTTVNDAITGLLDSAVAGTTTLSVDTDVTLSTTNGAANQARAAIILWTATGTTTRNITAPAQSKSYIVVNKTGGTQSIVIRGSGPTTGVTIPANTRALVAWNGVDFVKIVSNPISLSSDITGTLPIANGGTGQTSANAALNALLPSQTGNNTKVLRTDGTNTSWTDGGSGTVTSVTGNGSTNGLSLSGTVTAAGNITLSGSVTSLTTANFTIQESGGVLVFKYGATTIATLDSSGNLTTLANVTGYGSI